MRAEERLKEQLKKLPFGTEGYIKTLANLIYVRKDVIAKMYTSDVCMLGIRQVYGAEECEKYEKLLKKAYELITRSDEPGVCLFAAICLVMEGEKKINELIYFN